MLFVYGAESPVVPADALPELRGLLPGARFAAVDRAGHMIPWDNLDDFVAVVLQFTGARARRALTPSPLPAPTRWAARCSMSASRNPPAASPLSPAVAAAAFEHAPIATAIVQITDGEPWILEVNQAFATLVDRRGTTSSA